MEVSSRRNYKIGTFVGVILVMTLLIQAWLHRPQVDASHDFRAESFGRSVLALAPENALVFAKGDEAVFTFP